MPLLVKILCYLFSGLLTLYGLFGITPGFDDISKNQKFNKILHSLLVVLWRISFTISGVALFLLARYYAELSDTQMHILLTAILNHIILFVIILLGWFVLETIKLIIFFTLLISEILLWGLIFEPIWKKIKPFTNRIGLTPILKKCYTNVYLPFADFIWELGDS
jgi:hypothetical protein